MAQNINKCPACGSHRNSFAAVCPDCGYEFSDIQNSESVQKLADRLEDYDRQIAITGKPESGGTGCVTILLWIFLFPVMAGIFIFKLIKAKDEEFKGLEKAKSEAVMNFPVPNSREELLEFTLMLENRVKPINYFNALTDSGLNTHRWNNVWANKLYHIQRKAEIALKEDRDTMKHLQQSIQKVEAIQKENQKIQWIMIGALGVAFIALIIIAAVK